MKSHEIRQKYLDFFAARGHAVVPSSSLVPENDPTTLFTGSGMQPMVPFLLGEQHPAGKRLVDSQKCFRSQDIEEVGDNRHTTFFEMLGNWSLGDYFKQQQIPWMFEFLTKELGLDPNRLYVSAFRGNADLGIPKDDTSAELWKQCFNEYGITDTGIVDYPTMEEAEQVGFIPGNRIFYYPENKNWWSRAGVPDNMPVGEPGGPDTEMFWDFDPEEKNGIHATWIKNELSKITESFPKLKQKRANQKCHVNCDCGRFLEIGNNVFMEYVKTNDGFQPLPQKNVDFGGGLERLAAALNNDQDIFNLDLFKNAKDAIEQSTGKKYQENLATTFAFRVILDHIRAAVFLIADGVPPANKDRGYFVRRLIRRAVRYARHLDAKGKLLYTVAHAFMLAYEEVYPNLEAKRFYILGEIDQEVERFTKTLELGLREFKKILEKNNGFTGGDAFNLYQSYGFPLELTIEELEKNHGLPVDKVQFEHLFTVHRHLSKQGAEKKFAGGLADHSEDTTKLHTATHLLHQALRQILGDHVEQKGSNITAERLRFDFSHPQKMTPEEIKQVEDIVNEQIKRDLPVHAEQLTIEEAKARGAIGLFEDKYAQIGGKLNVYFMGDFSREICGGPHVEHTGQLGGIKILKEEASSAGVRRIKAVLGEHNQN